jgi:hypothetical protein
MIKILNSVKQREQIEMQLVEHVNICDILDMQNE